MAVGGSPWRWAGGWPGRKEGREYRRKWGEGRGENSRAPTLGQCSRLLLPGKLQKGEDTPSDLERSLGVSSRGPRGQGHRPQGPRDECSQPSCSGSQQDPLVRDGVSSLQNCAGNSLTCDLEGKALGVGVQLSPSEVYLDCHQPLPSFAL